MGNMRTEAQIRASNLWETKYKRVMLRLDEDTNIIVKRRASQLGLSINAYFKYLIDIDLRQEVEPGE